MDGQQVLSLKPYFDILYRHRIGAACVLAVGLGITLCSVLILPNIYRSSTVVLIQPQAVAPAYVSEPSATDTVNRVRILTEESLSRAGLQRIIQQLDLYRRERDGGEPMDVLVELMRRHISVDLTSGQQERDNNRLNSFTIAFDYPVPAIAQKVAARLADVYVDEDLRERSTQAEAASEFLRDQVTAAQAKLEEKTNEIKTYKTRYRGSLPEQLENNLQQLERLEEQLSNAQEALKVARQTSPETKLTQMETELTTMRAQYSDAHPDVVALRAQIEALKKSQASSSHSAPQDRPAQSDGTVGASVQALEAQSNELRRAIDQYRERIAQAPNREQELAGLNRDYEVLAKDYEQLLHKQLEAQVSARLEQRQEGERLRVLDPANLPLRPVRPNRTAILVLGVAFSMVGALALPFALFFTDTSFKDPDELSREFGVPVLVAIPLVDDAAERRELRWAAVRAVTASCVTLSAAVAAVWIYATHFF